MTPFETLERILSHFRKGRTGTAKNIYKNDLDKSFRQKLTKLILYYGQIGEIKWRGTFTSPYGEFTMTNEWLKMLTNLILEVES
jgi:hypothetical protein